MNTTKRGRAIEILHWGVGLAACAALLFVLVAAPIFYVDGDTETSVLFALAFLMPLVICAGLYLVGSYIIFGTKKGLLDFFQVVWGKIPVYLWFFLGVLYLGGIGTAFWRGADDAMVFGNDFSEGVGAGLAVFAIGGLGRLFRPNRLMGHVIMTTLIAIISLFFVLPKTEQAKAAGALSEHYSDAMYPLLSRNMDGNRLEAETLLFDPEFRMAAAASVSCENRSDLSMFVRDLWGANYPYLEGKYGRTIADNRSLIQETLRQFRAAGGCQG